MTTFGTGTRTWTRDPGATQGWAAAAGSAGGAPFHTPEDWGAIGDGYSHPASSIIGVSTLAELQAWAGGIYWFALSVDDEMDYLGVQAGLFAGGLLVGRPGAHYVINDQLICVLGRGNPDFRGSVLDFRAMTALSSAVNLVSNPTFAGGTDWANTSLPHTAVVFGAGVATWTDPGTGGTNFGQWGQQITIPAGQWRITAQVTITTGASAGVYGLPYCGFGFFGSGVGLGASVIDSSVTQTGTTSGAVTLQLDIAVTEDTIAWLTFSCGNGNVVVASPSIAPLFLNTAIWATADSWASGDGQDTHWRGGQFLGPGPDAGVACFTVKSFGDGGHALHLHEADIGTRGLLDTGGDPYAFSGGVIFSDQAYLCSLNHCTIGYCNPAVQFQAGAVNAGENMLLNRCTLYNGGTGLDVRGGGQWNLVGVSLDYQRTNFPLIDADRGAIVNLHGVNLETNAASVELIQCRGGALVNMVSGNILQGGGATATADAYVLVQDNLSAFKAGKVWIFGPRTASGDFARGAGRVEIEEILGPSNALMPDMLIRNHQMDRFGGAGRIYGLTTASDMGFYGPADGIGLVCSLHAASGTPTDRVTIPSEVGATVDSGYGHTAGYGSVKLLLDALFSGGGADWRVFYPVQPGRVGFDEFWYAKPDVVAAVPLGPYGGTDIITTTDGSAIVTITDASAASIGGSGPRPGWTVTLSGASAVGGIAAGTLNATHTVVARTGDNTFTIDVGSAATSAATGGGAVTTNYSQTSARIYDRRFWVAIVGQDTYGRPLIGQALFAGEVDFDVTCAAQDWTVQRMASWYTEISVPADETLRYGNGRAPAWATHMMMVLNFQNLDAIGAPPLYVTDYFANA